jgi:hypothetical protein
MTIPASVRAIVLIAPVGCLSAACSDAAGGPRLAELEMFVVDGAGHRTESHCTVVPVLPGGKALDDVDVAGEFSMHVDATPQVVLLTFSDVEEPGELRRELDVDELRAGYTEQLDVTTEAQRRFLVFLNSRCQ